MTDRHLLCYGSDGEETPFEREDSSDDDKQPDNFANTSLDKKTLQDALGLHYSQQNPTPLIEITPGSIDWNAEFQKLLDQSWSEPNTNNTHEVNKEVSRTVQLRKLCVKFAEVASKVGVTIINELYLDPSRKTIQPITKQVGGIAGGEKFVQEGIFFKLSSRDILGLYGGDSYAIKAAEHELKGTLAYLDCRIQGLYTPLVALIRYRGHQLLASSVLPINKSTLCYGSSDGGRSIHADDKEVCLKLEAAAKILNIKGHFVWSKAHVATFLHSPADLEVHRGNDGRIYVLDTARVFPPLVPTRKKKGEHLYQLFRPEFVKLNPVPLSSDAFSWFAGNNNIPDVKANNDDVADATMRLKTQTLPAFADYLEQRHAMLEEENNKKDEQLFEDADDLRAEMHLRGINMRYLLFVCSFAKSQKIRKTLLTEAVARTIKHLVEGRWRSVFSSDDTQYFRVAVELFNLVFGNTMDSELCWQTTVKDELVLRFELAPHSALAYQFQALDLNLKSFVDLAQLFFRSCDLLGLQFEFSKGLTEMQVLERCSHPQPFDIFEIVSIEPRAKYFHRVGFEEGTALCRLAMTKTGKEAFDLHERANEKFKECLILKPNDYRALYNWALNLSKQAEISSGDQAQRLWAEVADKYEKVLVLQPNDWRALWKWGSGLCIQAKASSVGQAFSLYKLACEKLLQAANIMPNFKTLYNAGNAHLNFAKLIEDNRLEGERNKERVRELLQNAVTLFSQASEADPKSADSTRNLAATYAKFARLCTDANKRDEYYKHCCDYYKRAYELDKNNRDLMFGWANALFRQAASWREDVPQKNDKTIIALLLQAAVKYSHSLQTPGPFFREAYINLGSVLLLVLRLNKRQVISLLGMKEYQKDFHDCACAYLEMENKHISFGSMRDFPYEDRILKLLSECDDLIIKSKASQVLSTLQPVEKKTAPMESVDEGKEFIISPRSPPLSFDRQEMSSLSQTVKRTEIDDAPRPVGSIISAAYLSPLARKKAKRKSNEAIRKGSDSPSSFKVTTSGSLGRATTRQWRSRSVPDALPNIFNLPSTGSDSSLVKGDKDRDREKESKDKEPKEKEKKRHRRLSIRRRARKSSEGLVKQPLTPIEIDWDQCVLYSYSIENMKLKKISESDLKIENIIGRHRYGMIFQVKWQSKEYVLKIFPKSSNILSNGLLVFKTPYLVKTEVIFHDETKIYYLFEAIKGVKFIQFIQETCKEKKLKEDMMMFYAQELFTIFECLEDCGFICRSIRNTVYRDFKSHNILLRDDGHLVSTVFWESNTDKSFSNAAISLLSPEIIKRLRSKQRSDSADIKKQTDYEDHVSMWWSFGVFLYICLVGKHPFKNDKNELREELMQKRKLPLPSDLSKACRSLIRELLESDPKKRLCSASTIKKHAFFSGCDWDNAKRSKNKPPLMPKVKAIPSYLTVPANTQLTASSGSMTNSESENSLDSSSSTINMQQPIGMTMFAPDASNLLEGFTVVVPSDDIDDV